jgi:chromosome partitioning protein
MPAKVLTIAQQKGGTGKTTVAAQLAVAWAGRGRRVALVDLDTQESLSAWYWLRREMHGDDADNIILHESTAGRLAMLLSRLKPDHDLVIIDSPPHTKTEAQVAIAKADLVVTPVQLSPMDLWATKPTLALAEKERVPALLVLNRVPPRGNMPAAVRDAIRQKKLPVARTTLGNRQAFASSLMEGRGVTETEPSSAAAAEVMALASELSRRLGRT